MRWSASHETGADCPMRTVLLKARKYWYLLNSDRICFLNQTKVNWRLQTFLTFLIKDDRTPFWSIQTQFNSLTCCPCYSSECERLATVWKVIYCLTSQQHEKIILRKRVKVAGTVVVKEFMRFWDRPDGWFVEECGEDLGGLIPHVVCLTEGFISPGTMWRVYVHRQLESYCKYHQTLTQGVSKHYASFSII